MDLSRSLVALPEDVESEGSADVRLEVHDASRLEWSVSVPLDASKARPYQIDLELEIPANVFARHAPWDQVQSWTRLDGPAEATTSRDPVTIDSLRRAAIACAHKLARASTAFRRHCRLAGSLSAAKERADLLDGLLLWLGVAEASVDDARAQIVAPGPKDGAELRRERQLVDEYLSVRLLEMLSSAERALASLTESQRASSYAAAIAEGEARLAAALARELDHRDACGYLRADPSSTNSLEQYLDRASRLKKHFQEVLFLEPETFHVAEKIHHWVAAFVAVIASTWAFAWQIALINRAPTTGTQIGSGVFFVAAAAGFVYAGKDRIKELGRAWISGHVHRLYAQRVAKWRAPSRRLPKRDVIVSAREAFDQAVRRQPDTLNPESGASMASTLIHFTHRGRVLPQAELVKGGVGRVKHIFRYDLSPLFARLDDAVKQVPVLDPTTKKVSFLAAPRVYRVPVRLSARADGETREVSATLVLHKRGLERLDFDDIDDEQ